MSTIKLKANIKDLARWDHISRTQCAYRSSHAQTGTAKCRNLFNNVSECTFYACPLIQEQYIGLQRDRDNNELLLIIKNPVAETTFNTWSFEVLPTEKTAALSRLSEAVKVLHPSVADAATRKFEHLSQIIETIKKSEELDLDLDSEVGSDTKSEKENS